MMKTCLNCGADFSSNYCNHCGQKELSEKITLKIIFHEILQVVFLLESPLLHTIKFVVVKPGLFVHSFLEGKRKPYMAPVQFFLLSVTLYLLVFNLMGEQYFAFITRSTSAISPEKVSRLGLDPQTILATVRKNLDIFYFFQPPIFALFFRILFSKTKISYAENLVFSFYLVGTGLLLSTVLALIALINVKILIVRLPFLLCFFPYAVVQFHRRRGFFEYLKGFIAVILSLLSYGICTGGITLLYYLIK